VFRTVEGLVAVGTIGLALGTFLVALLARSTAKATKSLALETRNLVGATLELARVSKEEVELSRLAVQAEVKPLIVDWPAFSQANGRSRRTRRTGVPPSRAEVERIFELQAEGLSQREIGERVGRARTSIMYVVQQGREEALRRLGAREDRELAKLVREALQKRLSQWHPSHTVAPNAEGRPLRELPDVSRRAVRLAARGAPRVPAMRLKGAAILGRVNGDSRDAGGRLPAGNGPAGGGERAGRSA
jgi:hypothetical protein